MKKIILGLVAMAVVVAGVAGMSAWEAHVINVTAHIENALAVEPNALDFGTVFPQEYLEKGFTVGLSTSFLAQNDAYQVDYKIVQKTKCICESQEYEDNTLCPEGQYAPVGYATHVCPERYTAMMSLCPYLSKLSGNLGTVSHPSYFQGEYCHPVVTRHESSTHNFSDTGWAGWSCPAGTYAVGGEVIENQHPMGPQGIAEPGAIIGGATYPVFPHHTFGLGETGYVAQNGGTSQTAKIYVDCMTIVPDASGILTLITNPSHNWKVDLKVPPFAGYVGQDWPAGCPVLRGNPEGTDLGCDLWIEVTNILRK